MKYRLPPGVPQIQCGQCGTICRAPAPPPTAQPSSTEPRPARRSRSNVGPPLAILAAGVAIAGFLVTGGILMVRMNASRPSPEQKKADQLAADEQAEHQRREAIVFREVDLPLSRRKELYRELRVATNATIDAKIPGGSKTSVGAFVGNNLEKVYERELELQALTNRVSKDDLREIYKEGDKKGW